MFLCVGSDLSEEKLLQKKIIIKENLLKQQLLRRDMAMQEDERKAFAYELHDNIGQIFTTCKLLLEQPLLKVNPDKNISSCYQYLQSSL